MARAMERRGFRLVRSFSRTLLLLIGAVQCLLGVIFGVSLTASAFIYAGDGPGPVASSILLLLLDLALFGVGLLALLSALEAWDPPGDRWRGIRWPVLGWLGGGATVLSWLIAATLIWAV